LAAASDLKGVKFRSYNPATAKIADMFGAQPVTIQAAELTQAMATGVVESYISSGSTGYDTKTFEHLKYFYDTQAWLPKNAVIVNQKAFDSLDKPTQAAVLKAAAEAEKRGWALSQEKTKWYLAQLRANGMTVAPPSSKMSEEFKKVGDVLVVDWLQKTGAEGKAILDAYNKK
jgi:TRAP-type C4-dicarboxylate transport system substrate-binding protein